VTSVKRPGGRPFPWEQGADPEPASFGTWLRRQREMRDISLRQIADSSKISLRYLEALEQDRFDVLPAAVFARGFLREYARYVGLNPDEVVNYFILAEKGGAPDEPEDRAPSARPSRDWTYGLLMAVGVAGLLGLVALLAYWGERRRQRVEATPPPIAAPPQEPAPVPLAPPPEPPAPGPPLRVTLDFVGDCWVEAAIDGARRVSELRVQGESLQLDAEEYVLLTLGDPQAVRIEVNGRPFALPGGASRVVRDLRIEAEPRPQPEPPPPENGEGTGAGGVEGG
jgi:cytoskeletal protein RodZ